MTDTERKIVQRLVSQALELGFSISVEDEEDLLIHRSTDETAIMGELGHSSDNILKFFRPDYRGFIHLIWGNSADVISDCSANRPVIDDLIEYANGQEQADD
jgi:hypothetical protein